MNIELHGLDARQIQYANTFWNCEELDEAEEFIQSLPTDDEQRDAQLVLDLMILAIIDQRVEVDESVDARAVLKQIAKIG